MTKSNFESSPSFKMANFSTQHIAITTDKIYMASRVCDKCGKTKDISGGKTCSKGHFICRSCAYGHSHCPLDGQTLR